MIHLQKYQLLQGNENAASATPISNPSLDNFLWRLIRSKISKYEFRPKISTQLWIAKNISTNMNFMFINKVAKSTFQKSRKQITKLTMSLAIMQVWGIGGSFILAYSFAESSMISLYFLGSLWCSSVRWSQRFPIPCKASAMLKVFDDNFACLINIGEVAWCHCKT